MFGDVPLVLVSDRAAHEAAVAALSAARVIGVDTESDSFYAYTEKVCLVQISDGAVDYVFDPLASGVDLRLLGPIMANADVVKIFHGADYDIVSLKRDFGYTVRNVFDTLVAGQQLGLPRVGLADLVGTWFGHSLDKALQRHNWALRPLRNEHLDYARGDTHWLPALRDILLRRLAIARRTRAVVEECLLLEKREWKPKAADPAAFMGVKGARSLEPEHLRVLRAVHAYRDRAARELDRPVFKVIPDDVLVDVARRSPTTDEQMGHSLPDRSSLRRRHGAGLLAAVREGLADERPIPGTPRRGERTPTPTGRRLPARQADRVLAELKLWRNGLVDAGRANGQHAAPSNGVLKSIATFRPRTLEELGAIPEVRDWQVADFGADLLTVLDRIDPP